MLKRCRAGAQNKSPQASLEAPALPGKKAFMRGASSTGGCAGGKLPARDANASNVIVEGPISCLGLVILLTFHEFGHGWVALKCSDDTAKMQGRVSRNPIDHLSPTATILLPLMVPCRLFGLA
jgi:hypothetical protein